MAPGLRGSVVCLSYLKDYLIIITYRIAENLAVWRSAFATTKLKSANISYLHIYVWQSLTELPNLNPPILLQWRFWVQPPNLIPANISGYTVIA